VSVWDDIRCEMPLPGGLLAADRVFMTRDTPVQFFENYTITADGRLIHHGRKWVPEEERPYRDHPSKLMRLCGALRPAPERDEEIAFNGDLTFADQSSASSPIYVACFVDGRCVRIFLEEDYRQRMETARRKMLAGELDD
jgi:hypothetical protein